MASYSDSLMDNRVVRNFANMFTRLPARLDDEHYQMLGHFGVIPEYDRRRGKNAKSVLSRCFIR